MSLLPSIHLDPDFGRLRKTLLRQEAPDRVPFLELFADPEIMTTILGEPVPETSVTDWPARCRRIDALIRFWHGLGYDAFWLAPIINMAFKRVDQTDTADVTQDKRHWVDQSVSQITNWQEFEAFPWPRPQDTDYSLLEYAAQHLPDGMKIIGSVRGPLEPAMWLMGYEAFALALYDQPDLIQALVDKLDSIHLPAAEALASMDCVGALWSGEDMGTKTATMIAPQHLRRYIFPSHKKLAAIAHAHDKPYLLHACGNLETVMDDLIDDVRIDAKHSFEDVIMPVGEAKRKYGERIALIGGVDVNTLCLATEDQVRAYTRRVLNDCMPGGGYVLGTGNSVANYIPVRNFLAMLDEGRRWRG